MEKERRRWLVSIQAQHSADSLLLRSFPHRQERVLKGGSFHALSAHLGCLNTSKKPHNFSLSDRHLHSMDRTDHKIDNCFKCQASIWCSGTGKKRSISKISFIPYFRLINAKVPPAESHIPLKNRSPKRKGLISKDPLLLYWVSMQKSGGHEVEMWHCLFALSFFLRTHPLLSLNKGRGSRCRCPGLHQCSLTFPA